MITGMMINNPSSQTDFCFNRGEKWAKGRRGFGAMESLMPKILIPFPRPVRQPGCVEFDPGSDPD